MITYRLQTVHKRTLVESPVKCSAVYKEIFCYSFHLLFLYLPIFEGHHRYPVLKIVTAQEICTILLIQYQNVVMHNKYVLFSSYNNRKLTIFFRLLLPAFS
jgi:hypothetical protein